AAAPRHQQVGDDDGRRPLFEQFQRLLGGAGGLALVVPGARSPDQHVLRDRFVIDDGDRDRVEIGLEPHGPARAEVGRSAWIPGQSVVCTETKLTWAPRSRSTSVHPTTRRGMGAIYHIPARMGIVGMTRPCTNSLGPGVVTLYVVINRAASKKYQRNRL